MYRFSIEVMILEPKDGEIQNYIINWSDLILRSNGKKGKNRRYTVIKDRYNLTKNKEEVSMDIFDSCGDMVKAKVIKK